MTDNRPSNDALKYFFARIRKDGFNTRLTKQDNKTLRDETDLADEIQGTITHLRKKQEQEKRDTLSLKKALNKIDQAIAILEKSKSDEARHTLENLKRTKTEAGEPGTRYNVTRMNIRLDDDSFASEVTKGAKNTDLIFELETFWNRHFGKRPTAADGHPFYELIELITDESAEALRKQRSRKAKPVAIPSRD